LEPLKIIKFMAGERHLALPSHSVREIVDSGANIKNLSYGGPALKGVINFEGELISVLETACMFDLKEAGREFLILICREKGMEGAVGLTVSAIEGMETIDISGIKPSSGNEAAYIRGFIRETGENVVALLDLGKLLDFALSRIDDIE